MGSGRWGAAMSRNAGNDSSATYVEVQCQNHFAQYGGCYHLHKWSVPHLAAIWGSVEAFKRLRFVCTHCGSRRFDFNFRCPLDQGGNAIWPSIEYHYHMSAYRWRHLRHELWRGGYYSESAVGE